MLRNKFQSLKKKNELLRKLDFQIPKSLDETDQMHENEREQIQKLGESSSKYDEVRIKARILSNYKQSKSKLTSDH